VPCDLRGWIRQETVHAHALATYTLVTLAAYTLATLATYTRVTLATHTRLPHTAFTHVTPSACTSTPAGPTPPARLQ